MTPGLHPEIPAASCPYGKLSHKLVDELQRLRRSLKRSGVCMDTKYIRGGNPFIDSSAGPPGFLGYDSNK